MSSVTRRDLARRRPGRGGWGPVSPLRLALLLVLVAVCVVAFLLGRGGF